MCRRWSVTSGEPAPRCPNTTWHAAAIGFLVRFTGNGVQAVQFGEEAATRETNSAAATRSTLNSMQEPWTPIRLEDRRRDVIDHNVSTGSWSILKSSICETPLIRLDVALHLNDALSSWARANRKNRKTFFVNDGFQLCKKDEPKGHLSPSQV